MYDSSFASFSCKLELTVNSYTAPIAHIYKEGTTKLDEYVHLFRDRLGSILSIANAEGTVLEQSHYGAWGTIEEFSNLAGASSFTYNTSLLGRGYTGHEHFVSVGLIHMNGRMYDAYLGRFLSPDNYIQQPFNTQNYNRYGYVLNNPLSYNDPSGESFWKRVASIFASVVFSAVGVITAVATGGLIGFVGYVDFNTGDWQVYTGGVWSSGGAFLNFGVKDGEFGFYGGFSFSPDSSNNNDTVDGTETKNEQENNDSGSGNGGGSDTGNNSENDGVNEKLGNGNDYPYDVTLIVGPLQFIEVSYDYVIQRHVNFGTYSSLSMSGVLGGGLGFELGYVTDGNNDSSMFFTLSGHAGLGSGFGVNTGVIIPQGNYQFVIDDFSGEGAGVEGQIGVISLSESGNFDEKGRKSFEDYGKGKRGYKTAGVSVTRFGVGGSIFRSKTWTFLKF